jgi:hypothetical protein
MAPTALPERKTWEQMYCGKGKLVICLTDVNPDAVPCASPKTRRNQYYKSLLENHVKPITTNSTGTRKSKFLQIVPKTTRATTQKDLKRHVNQTLQNSPDKQDDSHKTIDRQNSFE